MDHRKDKLILVDCDGVLLDWEYAFDRWMKRHGYEILVDDVYKMDVKYGLDITESKKLCRMFNESATIRRLPPLRDAIKYVKKLHEEHGYVFHAITSLSKDANACELRRMNLQKLFGKTASGFRGDSVSLTTITSTPASCNLATKLSNSCWASDLISSGLRPS